MERLLAQLVRIEVQSVVAPQSRGAVLVHNRIHPRFMVHPAVSSHDAKAAKIAYFVLRSAKHGRGDLLIP